MTSLCSRLFCTVMVTVLVMTCKAFPVHAQNSPRQNLDSDTPHQIRSSDLLKTDIMFVGAHPDDESSMTGAMAGETIDGGARGALVFATRGEGGGNAIGKQLGPALGALREAEVRKAASSYGVDLVYFLDKTDFFYTMSARAAFDVWDHDDSLARLVRLVRLLQPEIIVTMWPGPGTHGMHQAAARLATEAFSAAADPLAFPDQITAESLELWQTRRLYYTGNRPGAFGISNAQISPSRFMSYAEIKSIALRNYRSQAFDRRDSLLRTGTEWFLLVKSTVPVTGPSVGLLDGMDLPVQQGISLAPGKPQALASIQIVPRRDISEFRAWAEEHDVAWAAGLLPAVVTMAVDQVDTVLVEIRNHNDALLNGDLTLSLPDSWSKDSVSKPYTVPARSTAMMPYLVSVPEAAGNGRYQVVASTQIEGEAIADYGEILTVPRTIVTRAINTVSVDGRLGEWDDNGKMQIPSDNIWSGQLPGGDEDCSAIARVQYDSEYLYFAVEVLDDKVVMNIPPDDVKAPWRSDAVEICIDPSGQGAESTLSVFKTGIFPGTTSGPGARAMRDADARPGIIEQSAPGMRVASTITDVGYTLEVAIAWEDVPGGQPPAPGTEMGLNIIVYDGDDTEAGSGANIGKARIGWSAHRNAQVLPYHYGRAVIE